MTLLSHTTKPDLTPVRAESASFWDSLDAVLVINLKHRTDRWERMHRILSRHVPEEKIIRVDAIYGKDLPGYGKRPWFGKRTSDEVASHKAGAAGCCLSHRKAIEMAKQAGYKRILLMEDDADFHNELDTPEGDAIADLIHEDDTWDMLYLGYYQRLNMHHVARRHEINGQTLELWRIRGPLMVHAVVIHERIYDKLLNGLPTLKYLWFWMTYWGSIDSYFYNAFGRDPKVRIWATEPKLVMQNVGYSDICGRDLLADEALGTHRPTDLVPLDAQAFERSIPRSLIERLYQIAKRSGRCARAALRGYHKT